MNIQDNSHDDIGKALDKRIEELKKALAEAEKEHEAARKRLAAREREYAQEIARRTKKDDTV